MRSLPKDSAGPANPHVMLHILRAECLARRVHPWEIKGHGDFMLSTQTLGAKTESRIDAVAEDGELLSAVILHYTEYGFALVFDVGWSGKLQALSINDAIWSAQREAWLSTEDAVSSVLLQWRLLSPSIENPLMARRFRRLMAARWERWCQVFELSYEEENELS